VVQFKHLKFATPARASLRSGIFKFATPRRRHSLRLLQTQSRKP